MNVKNIAETLDAARKRIRQTEEAIRRATQAELDLLKADTGLSPEDIDFSLVEVITFGERSPRYVFRDVKLRISL
jgi:hypothetical protein